MSIELIGKIKPKNGGKFPLMDAEDVLMPNGTRLNEFKGGLTVTVGEDGTASHTSAEIYAHVQSGGNAILETDGELFPIQAYDGDFLFGGMNGTVFSGYWVLADGSTEFVSTTYADGESLESVAKMAENNRQSVDYFEQEVPNKIPTPTTAKVGQTIVVKEVDENGKPTEWECKDYYGLSPTAIATIAADTVDEKFPSMTQAEYDALVTAGTVDENKYYMIVGEST